MNFDQQAVGDTSRRGYNRGGFLLEVDQLTIGDIMRTGAILVLAYTAIVLESEPLPSKIKDSSVMVSSENGHGSGVLFKNDKYSFVWTAAHVVPNPSIKTVIDPVALKPTVDIRFSDVSIVQVISEDGRVVGKTVFDAEVVRYSPKNDIALLLIRRRNYSDASTSFFGGVPKQGDSIWHVGSMKGEIGACSVSEGTFAFAGRVNRDGLVLDQVSAIAHKGSSGGGIFLKSNGKCVGIISRFISGIGPEGAPHGAFCIVPSRTILSFAKKHGVEFAVKDDIKVPNTIPGPIYVDAVPLPRDYPVPKQKVGVADIVDIIRLLPAGY